MPAKPKGSSKAAASTDLKAAQEPPPETIAERSTQRFYHTNPLEKRREDVGIQGFTPAERKTYAHASLIVPVSQDKIPLSHKAEREYWKSITKEGLPIRRLRRGYNWGKDRSGRDLATYKIQDFEARSLKQARLTALNLVHHKFLADTDAARRQGTDISQDIIEEEKTRRKTMAELRQELYGEQTGSLAEDPTWDDVIPIPQNEPEGALAQIAYPDDYAEAVSYLRAVMAVEECSPRCLRLTDHVISMNPAHYTVWLYRFKIVKHLGLPVREEIDWLNQVALANLKNYQIWHHRQLLMDYHYSTVASEGPDAVRRLAKSETAFIDQMLEEDTKNYHVWSYRQYLVGKLGLWTPAELGATQNMIEDDVRNNSAWSHRFFLVFSDPERSTPDAAPTAHDPKIPAEVVERELRYAREKILLAPQNQSSWNYLRGVLAKGGRGVDTETEFAEQFVAKIGEDGEEVRSSHALDLLADAYVLKGEKRKARVCLQRLADKWDPVREGYWKYRAKELGSA